MKKSTIYTVLAALLLAVVAVWFFFPDAIEGNVLRQHDMMQGIANGEEGRAFHEATGETTRWTDALFGGMPNFQIAPSYPAGDMLGWIGKLYGLWLPSPANLLFGMMLGFFIMCLCMKMRWPAALFGAIAWGLSTYFIIIIGAGHIWKFVTLSYIPPTIGGIALLYRHKYLAGTALAALFGALQLQSNHPQMSYYFLFVIAFMALAWLWTAWREHTLQQWGIATGCMILAGALGVAANSGSLYNSYEYSKETVRGRSTYLSADAQGQPARQGADKAWITAWSYGADETFSLLIPNVKGGATIKPVAGQNQLMSVADTDKAAEMDLAPEMMQFVGQFPQYFGDQPMTNGPVYVGALVLMLAILALFVVQGPMKWALLAATLLSVLLSWGHNFPALTDWMIDHFPGYDKFRTVSSILVIAEFTLPLLAAMCVARIAAEPGTVTHNPWTFYCVMGIGAAVCLAGWMAPSLFGTPYSASELDQLQQSGLLSDSAYAPLWTAISESRLSLVSADSLRSLLYILIGALLIWLYTRGILRNRTLFVCALTAVVLIDLFSVNKRYVNSENFTAPEETETEFAMTPADELILHDKSHYRVMDIAGFGDARSSYFHNTVGGYHAAKLTRYNDLIEHQISKGNPAVLNMLNAKYILNGNDVQHNPGALGNAWFADRLTYVDGADAEMAALDTLDTSAGAVADRAFAKTLGNAVPRQPGDTITLTSYAPNRLKYATHSARGGVAVFSEIYFPWGWSATVDGKPVEISRANYVLRALRIPAGDHRVEFVFDPQSMRVTDTLSICSTAVIYLLCIAAAALPAWRRRKKATGNTTR